MFFRLKISEHQNITLKNNEYEVLPYSQLHFRSLILHYFYDVESIKQSKLIGYKFPHQSTLTHVLWIDYKTSCFTFNH